MTLPSGLVTFLLTDVVDSTRLWESAPADMERALARHQALLGAAVARRGGIVLKARGEGDSTFSVFARTSDAVAAAIDASEALAAEPWPDSARIAVRMALHAGEAVERDGDYYGRTVNRAARLRGLAAAGQIVVSNAVAEIVVDQLPDGAEMASMGLHQLRGVSRPEHVFVLQRSGQIPAPLTSDRDPVGTSQLVVVPLPARLAASSPGGGFVGRTRELDLLVERAAETDEGTPRVVVVAGEPGIGKTRLVAEAARRLHDDGTIVLYGRCDEDLGIPYQPFLEALRYYVEHAPAAALAGFAARWGGELARLVPELTSRAFVSPATATDPETERALLFESVVRLLAAASADQPVVLVLDDLHWADRNTQLLFGHVSRAPLPMRLLVIATYRDSEVGRDHPLRDVVADLLREPGVERLVMHGLEEDEVVALVTFMARHDLDDHGVALGRWLRRETGGSPFFAAEILRNLAESGVIRHVGDRWRLDMDLDKLRPPDSVRDVVNRRVARLGQLAEQTLATASVIGRDFEVALLARVLDTDEEPVLDTLEAAAGAALVSETGNAPGRFTFAHALIGRTLYDGIGATRRARTHRRVAEALEELCGGDPGERLPELAGHWLAAQVPAEAQRAIGYARKAGDHALAQLAPDEASRWYQRALDAGAKDLVRCDLLIDLGIAQRHAGNSTYRSTLLNAADMARALGHVEGLVRAALANNRGDASVTGSVDEERVGVLEAALAAIAPDDSAPRARLLSTLALELTYAGDWDRRLGLSDDALAMARRIGDPTTLAWVLLQRESAIQAPTTLAERIACIDELEPIAESLGDPVLRGYAAWGRVHLAWEQGDVAEVDRFMPVQGALADYHSTIKWRWLAARDCRTMLGGLTEEAERGAHQSFAWAVSIGQPEAGAVFAARLFDIRWAQGRLSELEPMVKQVIEEHPGISAFRAILALIHCESDRFDEARRVFEHDAKDEFSAIQMDPTWAGCISTLAEVAAQLGDRQRCAQLYAQLAPFRAQFVTSGARVGGPYTYYLGQMATVMESYGDAERDLCDATQTSERIGGVVFLARSRLARAKMLLARQGRHDRAQAGAEAAEALAIARRVGMTTVERRAARIVEDTRGA